MTDGHCFISYSTADALDFATKLANKLKGGNIPVWFDKDDLKPSMDWDIQIDHALKTCRMVLFVMTTDSTHEKSVCRQEWSRALSYKKSIIPLWVQNDIDVPFRLQDRQRIDFRKSFDAGLANLRDYLAWLDSPEGVLQEYKDRLLDAERDIQRASDEYKPRIQAEIEDLTKLIETQQKIVDNPRAAEKQTEINIKTGLERERQPEKPIAGKGSTKFINPPPGVAPTYFQDRTAETKEIVRFLHTDSQRLLTVVGRGGVGKTAAVCRLLKHLESGTLPDDLEKIFGETKIDGIVYLSESGSHRVNFANIFSDLCKLLSAEIANSLDAIYKHPQLSTSAKMSTLLDQFTDRKVVLLLDNIEPLINVVTFGIGDAELDESLCAFLKGAHSAVKIILTTRIAPRGLNLCEPGRQRVLSLDEGLESPYAENILREMDYDGKLGLKNAPDELLAHAREHTRGYPRALEALYAILSSDRYTSLEEILTTAENYLPDYVVQSLVGEAFSRLDGNAQKVMQALAIYNRPVVPAAIDYLLAQHLPGIDSVPILNRLVTMRFVRRESGRYYLHPVDREFAISRIPAEESKIGWDQKSLTLNAADYFAQARKPRAEWKKLDDLAAQLAEFDLRCAAGDYDSAASVLRWIDFDYMLLWGHYKLMITFCEMLRGKVIDSTLHIGNLGNLAIAYANVGQTQKAIGYYEQALESARENKIRYSEGAILDNLGNAYARLGDARKAIEFHEQALVIAHEIGNRRSEATALGNLGSRYADLGDASKAVDFYEQALVIEREIGDRSGEGIGLGNIAEQRINLGEYELAIESAVQYIKICEEISKPASYAYYRLAQAYLHTEEFIKARETIEAALQYDEPMNNHNATALHGIIALRQRERKTAQEAFTKAIGQADEILAKTPEYYDALDAKGLALCGLVLVGDSHLRGDCHLLAIETFRAARKIAPHGGIVKSVLRLFDELAKCDEEGVLAEVRKAAEGT